jgi:purine nucleoside permease
MEDTGTLQSLTFLSKAGRVDINRVMVLRTASDFDQPVPGRSAAESLALNKIGKYTGYYPALEAAWRVGHVVVSKIVEDWTQYRDKKW